MAFEKDPNEIGALWNKFTAAGKPYMTGEIGGQKVVIFQTASQNPRAPNWRVLKSVPKADASATANATPDHDDIGF